MAVVQYSNVYRSGAASGSPVTSLYVVDDFVDFPPSSIAGDIIFVKTQGLVYLGFDNGWIPIVVQDMRFNLIGNVVIEKTRPALILKEPNTSQVRVYNIGGNNHITTNCSFNGSAWIIDDVTYDGQVIVQNYNASAMVIYRVRKADGGVEEKVRIDTNNGSIVSAGVFYERSRAVAVGDTQIFATNSGNYWGSEGMIVTPVNPTEYIYWLIGNRMYVSLWLTFNLSGPQGQYIYVHTPGAAYNGIRVLEGSACTIYNVNTGHMAGRAYIGQGNNYISFYKTPIQPMVNGTCEISAQFSFQFS